MFGAVVFSYLDESIISLISPVWKTENVIARSLRNGSTFFNSQKTLVAENAALREKLSSLEIEILSLSSRQVQESTLLELLNRKQEADAIAAAVLIHPPQTPYDVILIDAGADDFITLGSEVSSPEGPVLGTVSEVFPRKARVKFFSTAGEETNAVLERDNIPVTLTGAGGGNFKFILPRDLRVEKGDRIFSADISTRLLAVVAEVNVRSTDSFKEVLARSPTNIFALRFVFVTP